MPSRGWARHDWIAVGFVCWMRNQTSGHRGPVTDPSTNGKVRPAQFLPSSILTLWQLLQAKEKKDRKRTRAKVRTCTEEHVHSTCSVLAPAVRIVLVASATSHIRCNTYVLVPDIVLRQRATKDDTAALLLLLLKHEKLCAGLVLQMSSPEAEAPVTSFESPLPSTYVCTSVLRSTP